MKTLLHMMLIVLCAGALLGVVAQPEYPFEQAAAKQQFDHLTHAFRCLVCQNQSLAESNAKLASDLKSIIYESVQRGDSDQQVIDYLTSRYGDFILYSPPLQRSTWLLWFGPLVLFILALGAAMSFVRVSIKP